MWDIESALIGMHSSRCVLNLKIIFLKGHNPSSNFVWRILKAIEVVGDLLLVICCDHRGMDETD